MREQVLTLLHDKKAGGSFSVIDVGGTANPWCDKYVDAYLDIKPVESVKPLFLGDINVPETWAQFGDKQFDFSICTHTLEDIRDPLIAIKGLLRISRSGYIAVPSKYVEFSNVENLAWLGCYHHRWIFDIEDDRLIAFPKLPGISYFSWQNLPIRLLNTPILGAITYALHIKRSPKVFGGGLKPLVVGTNRPPELGILWERDMPFQFIDYFLTHYRYLEFCRERLAR